MGLLRPFVITALAVFLLAWALPTVHYGNTTTLIMASIVLVFLQKIGRPILHLLLLPINIVTLGLFSGAISVILIWLATALVPGFYVEPMIVFGFKLNYFFSLMLVAFLLSFLQGTIAILF